MEAPWIKNVVREGNGSSPSDGYSCALEIEVTAGQIKDLGEPFYEHEEGKFTGSLTICRRSSSPVLTLLGNIANSMSMGEISTFTLSPESRQNIGITDASELVVNVHLMSMDKPVCDLSATERLNYAKEEKTLGTQYFKDGNIELAFSKFSNAAKALITLSEEPDLDEQAVSDIDQLRCLVHSNLALCQLKTNNYDGVIKNCDVAEQLDPTCQKAFFRRGQAYVGLGKFEAAKIDFEKVCLLDPQNKVAQKEAQKAAENLKKSDAKLGKALSKMFV